MNEPTPNSTTDRLRRTLAATADELPLSPADVGSVVQTGTTRRRRRRIGAVGGAVAVVALVGAVVANRDNGDATIEFTNPPETTEVDGTTETPTTAPVTTPITTPATLPPIESDSTAGFELAGTIAVAPTGDMSQLLPWRDGFLSLGFEHTAQPLAPLSEEISALFPEEVRALFPDGLPPTIEEATAVLSDAGLLDEVSTVLAEHPEAFEAVYAEPVPPPTLSVSFTRDGVEWTNVEMTSPMPFGGQFSVSGDRLVAWSMFDQEPTASTALTSGRTLTIAWTSDLTDWHTESIDLSDLSSPPNAAEHIRSDAYVNSVALIGDRWVAQLQRQTWVDYESLLPADLFDQLRSSTEGYGMGASDDGLEVEFTTPAGENVKRILTWAELGLDGNPESEFEDSRAVMLSGEFGLGFEATPVASGFDFGVISTLGDRFVFVGERVLTSADGISWQPLAGLPDDRHFQSVTAVTGGHLLIGDGPGGPLAWLRRDDGSITEAQLPELPERYGLWSENASAAWITEVGGEYGDFENEPFTVTFERDGYVLTLVQGPEGTAYTLADAATGAVVANGADIPNPDSTGIWQVDEETGDSTIVISDDDGAELLRIPPDVVRETFDAAYSTTEASEPEVWDPDLWLIATADGHNWLTVDVPEPDPESGFWPSAAAVNGDSVLYRVVDGWVLEALPTGS